MSSFRDLERAVVGAEIFRSLADYHRSLLANYQETITPTLGLYLFGQGRAATVMSLLMCLFEHKP